MTVRRKQCRFVIAEMTQSVCRQFTCPHCFHQTRDLTRTASHQGTFQAGQIQAIEHTCSNPDHVLGRGAHFSPCEIVSFVKAEQLRAERVDDVFRQRRIVGVNHHAVGDTGSKVLNMPGADPNGNPDRLLNALADNFCQPFARFNLQSFHTKDKALSLHREMIDPAAQRTQFLCADGNNNRIRVLQGFP